MKTKSLILILILFVFLSTCKKDFETPTGGNKIEFKNTTVDSVSYSWVQLTTQFTGTGGNEIPQHGYCWSTGQKPTIEDNKIELGSLDNSGNIQISIDSLTNNTNYYIRFFLAYYGGILYGDEASIKTLKTGIPIVLTSEVSDVTLYTAVCGGTIEADSGLFVSARGICWDTINEFNIDDCLNKTINGDSLGSFTSNITELEEGKDYFVKAYATNEKGTGYGDIKTFSTIPLSLPEVQTSNISEITTTSAVGGGEVINNGNGTITARGIYWNTSDNVSLENNIGFTENGTEIGSFISNLTDLTDGTIYYVVAYSINEKGTGYGEIKSFQTVAIGAPTVITSDVTNITTISAQCGGNVTNSGNGTVTARGVCWNITGNPTLDNCLNNTENGIGLGVFNSSLTGLTEGTTYYVSAYATNEIGTSYGNAKTFNTIAITIPGVTTFEVTNITQNSADCGGNVTSNGNGTVISRGVCWNTTGDPTLTNCINYTTDGSGTGNFTSNITALQENTIYYVAAYATNEKGTAYGLIKQFTTNSTTLPVVITADVINITTNSAQCGGNVTNTGNGTVSAKGVCWNTTGNPTLENCDDFTTDGTGMGSYVSYLTDLDESTLYFVTAYATNENGTAYGTIKYFTTLFTLTIPTVITADVTNITSDSAQCGGNVTSNGNGTVNARGVCWNATGNPTLENCDDFTTDGSGLGTFISYLTGLAANTEYYVIAYATNEEGTAYGDIESFTTLEITIPTVITSDVTNITPDSAQCGGNVTSNGNGMVSARGVCWNTTGNPTLDNCDDFTTDGSGLGTFISYLTGLVANTEYYVTSYATNEEGTAYGDIETFTTLQSFICGDQINYGGQTYNTVLIGDQCWMEENLNIGTRIDGVNDQTDNSMIEKYCYDDNENNCDEYGALYQWNEMMQYTTTQGTQGICPSAWHLPTDDEWKILEGTVDSQYGVGDPEWNGSGWRGFDAGKNLKSTYGWYLGNNGLDTFGFTALPSGLYNGGFVQIERSAYFWSSNDDINYAWYRYLHHNMDEVIRDKYDKVCGFSVRCIKN